MTTLREIIGAFASDAVTVVSTAAGFPVPGAFVGGVLSEYIHRCSSEARDILMEEIRRAGATNALVASQDDTIAVIWRFLRASTEGTARLNLRLLAKTIVGQIQAGTLVAEEFLAYADSLASLSRDEILVIGTMYKYWKAHQDLAATDQQQAATKYGDPWGLTLQDATNIGMSEDDISTAASRAQRSGLLYAMSPPSSSWQASALASGLVYRVSPLLIALGKTVDFGDALRRETGHVQAPVGSTIE
jgi:hypothetical protein